MVAAPIPKTFQTYPRGVEVQTARDAIGTDGGFRRTLVGLK